MNSWYSLRDQNQPSANDVLSAEISSSSRSDKICHLLKLLSLMLIIISSLFTACDSGPNTSATNNAKQTLPVGSGSTITYSTRSQDVLLRTFYGGGKIGTFEMSPEISIYGDGSFVLGPGLQMRQGKLRTQA